MQTNTNKELDTRIGFATGKLKLAIYGPAAFEDGVPDEMWVAFDQAFDHGYLDGMTGKCTFIIKNDSTIPELWTKIDLMVYHAYAGTTPSTEDQLMQALAEIRGLFPYCEDMIPAIGDPLEVPAFVRKKVAEMQRSLIIPLLVLYELWDGLGDAITVIDGIDVDCLEDDFLHFKAGTHREEVWRWFEAKNSLFVVGDVMQGIKIKIEDMQPA